MLDDRNWLATELSNRRRNRRQLYIGLAAGLCLVIAVIGFLAFPSKHSIGTRLADSTSAQASGEASRSNTIAISSDSSQSTSATGAAKDTQTSTPTPALPTSLSGTDEAIFNKAFDDAYSYAGALDGPDTDTSPASAQALSDDIQAVKGINTSNYAFSTGEAIISAESDIIIAFNQYTQAYADSSQAADLESEGSSQTQIDSDNTQKLSGVNSANESIQSAKVALSGVEL